MVYDGVRHRFRATPESSPHVSTPGVVRRETLHGHYPDHQRREPYFGYFRQNAFHTIYKDNNLQSKNNPSAKSFPISGHNFSWTADAELSRQIINFIGE